MERLLKDAQAISGIEYNVSSYADIVEAIHVIQTQMGITGTTALEAADTISGSAGSVSAAWKNLKIELGKENGDIQDKFTLLANSIATTAQNIIPRVKQILSGIGEAVRTITPLIAKEIPQIATDLLPDLLKSAVTLTKALATGIVSLIPSLWTTVKSAVNKIDFAGFGKQLGTYIKQGLQVISDFVGELDWKKIAKSIGDFIMHIDWLGILRNVSNVLVSLIKAVPDIIGGFYHSVVDGLTDLLNGDLSGIDRDLSDVFDNASRSTKDMRNELKNARDSMNELKGVAKETAEKGLAQVEKTQSLYNELLTLVDANGKVKTGYEERADFITQQLSQATGEEITMIDGQIQKYGELKESIKDLIQQKRASVLGNAYEDVYTNALIESKTAGDRAYEIQNAIAENEATLNDYYKQFRIKLASKANQDLQDMGFSMEEIYGLRQASSEEFMRSVGTDNKIDDAMNILLGQEAYTGITKASQNRIANKQNYNDLQSSQQEINNIIAFYDKAQTAASNGQYYLAQSYYDKITEVQNGTYMGIEETTDDTLNYIETQLTEALGRYNDAVKINSVDADTTLRGTIESLVEYGNQEGVSGADKTKEGIIAVLSSMDSFDTGKLEEFMAATGLTFGELIKSGIYEKVDEIKQSEIWQGMWSDMLAELNEARQNSTTGYGLINSLGDVAVYRPHARGGIFHGETHIFGEAGDEAVVPLANDELGIRQIADAITQNMSGGNTVINVNLDGANISSDYDIDRLTDRFMEKISEGLESLKIRDNRGYGGVFA